MELTKSEQVILEVLKEEEKLLRDKILKLAEQYKYNELVFEDKGSLTMGDSVRNGLNNRWINLIRLIDGLSNGLFNGVWVLREFDQDSDLLKKIHKKL